MLLYEIMPDYNQIVWLASYPKSGNTWIRCFLDAYLTGEIDINELLCSVRDDIIGPRQLGDGSDIRDFPFSMQILTRPIGMLRIVNKYLEEPQQAPLLIKTHAPNLTIDGIDLIPKSLTKRVIHIVRDPRDVLPSYAKHMGVDLDRALEWMSDKYRVIQAKDRMIDLVSSWGYHTRSYLDSEDLPVETIKYEDLRTNPFAGFCRIVELCGMIPDFGRVKKAMNMVELSKLVAKERKEGFYESSPHAKDKFFGKGEVGGWRSKLTPKQIHTIEKRFGSVMKRLDYLQKRRAA